MKNINENIVFIYIPTFAFVRKSVSVNVTGYGLTVVMKGN